MNYSVHSCKMPNYLHEKQSRFCPQNYRVSLCSQLVGKHMASSTAQPKQCKKLQKQNTCKLHLSAVWGFVPRSQVRREMAVSRPTAQQYLSRLSHERSELALSGSRHKAACSPRFAQGQGPGLCP